MHASDEDLANPVLDTIEMIDVLQALADPVRLQLFRQLDEADGAIPCNEISLPVSKSTRSHHFKVLREAGLIEARLEGTRRFYTVRRDEVDARFPGLVDAILGGG